MKKYLNKILFAFLIIFTVILFVFCFGKNIRYIRKSYNKNIGAVYVDVWKEKTLNQYFEVNVDNLSKISVLINSNGKLLVDKELLMKIYDENDNEIRSSISIIENLDTLGYFDFSFDKIEDSLGKKFKFSLNCTNCSSEESINIYGNNYEKEGLYASVDDNIFNIRTTMEMTGDYYFIEGIILVSILLIVNLYLLICFNISKLVEKINFIKEIFKLKLLYYSIYFMISLILGILIFRLIYLYNYEYYISIPIVIVSIILVNFLLFEVAYLFRIKKIKMEDLFLILFIPISMFYYLFVIPTWVPDELVHYASAYKITNFEFAETKDYVDIPQQLVTYQVYNTPNYEVFGSYLLDVPTSDVGKTTTTGYSIFTYIPSIIGIFVGRILNLPHVITFYLARILMLITTTLVMYYAIKIIPFGKSAMTVYALNPMFVHQSISVVSDTIINSVSLLFIAYTLHLYFKIKLSKKDLIILFILMAIVSTFKYVYIVLVFLPIMFLFKKKDKLDFKQKRMLSLFIIISILICVGMFIYNQSIPVKVVSDYVITNNVDLKKQLLNIIKSPLILFSTLINTYRFKFDFYLNTFLGGKLGWLNIDINSTILYLYFFILILSLFMEKNEKSLKNEAKIIPLLITIFTILLIIFVMYLSWTSVGANVVEGVQGRYFIPIAILGLLMLCNKKRYLEFKHPYLIISMLLVFVHFNVLCTLIKYFIY